MDIKCNDLQPCDSIGQLRSILGRGSSVLYVPILTGVDNDVALKSV
jgi:hypothetical protein